MLNIGCMRRLAVDDMWSIQELFLPWPYPWTRGLGSADPRIWAASSEKWNLTIFLKRPWSLSISGQLWCSWDCVRRKCDEHVISWRGTVTELRQNTEGMATILVPLIQQAACQWGTYMDCLSWFNRERHWTAQLSPCLSHNNLPVFDTFTAPHCLINGKSHLIPAFTDTIHLVHVSAVSLTCPKVNISTHRFVSCAALCRSVLRESEKKKII